MGSAGEDLVMRRFIHIHICFSVRFEYISVGSRAVIEDMLWKFYV